MEIKIEDKTDHADFELVAETGDPYFLLSKRFSGPLEHVYMVSDSLPERFGGGRHVHAKIVSNWDERYTPMSIEQCAESANKLLDRLSEDETFVDFKLHVDNQRYVLRYLELLDKDDNKVASMYFSSDNFSVTFATIKDTDPMEIAKKLDLEAHLCAAILRHALIELADAMPALKKSLDAEDMTFTLKLDAEAGRKRAEMANKVVANFMSQLASNAQTNPDDARLLSRIKSNTEENSNRSGVPTLIGTAEGITFAWDSKMTGALIAALDEKRPPEFYRKIVAGNIIWGLMKLEEGNIGEAMHYLGTMGLSKVKREDKKIQNAIDEALEGSLMELLGPLQRERRVSDDTIQKVKHVRSQVKEHLETRQSQRCR